MFMQWILTILMWHFGHKITWNVFQTATFINVAPIGAKDWQISRGSPGQPLDDLEHPMDSAKANTSFRRVLFASEVGQNIWAYTTPPPQPLSFRHGPTCKEGNT